MASLPVNYSALANPLRISDGSQSGDGDTEMKVEQSSHSSATASLLETEYYDIRYSVAPASVAAHETSSPKSQNRKKRRRLQGWRFGVALAAILATIVLLTNVISAISASLSCDMTEGIGDLYVGNCDLVNRMNMGLHVLINTLSSMLLSTSNYTMQCLSSPTRKECDKAHTRGDWLDIGVPGIRNWTKINWQRRVLWALLALSSIPIHLLYNSAVFKTLDTNYSRYVVASEDYLLGKKPFFDDANAISFGESFNLAGNTTVSLSYDGDFAESMQSTYLADSSLFDRLDVVECMSTYGVNYLSGHSDLILVTHEQGSKPDQNVFFAERQVFGSTGAYDWICSEGPLFGTFAVEADRCDAAAMKVKETDWRPFFRKKIDYCLALRVEHNCKLQFSIHILVVVIVCNIIKTLVILWILFRQRESTLVTFGDAIASWLDNPDEHTKGQCLSNKSKLLCGQDGWSSRSNDHNASTGLLSITSNAEPTTFVPAPIRRWHHAVSTRRWAITLTLCIGAIAATCALLGMGIQTANANNIPSPITTLGFGSVHPNAIVGLGFPETGTQWFILCVLVANSPQLILSFLYMMYNGLYTCMHLAHEYSGYGNHRKALRVTTPRGQQRSTYWLQLPYTYGIPLIIFSGVLHWLCSQSIFVVRILHNARGSDRPAPVVSTVGYSPAPILCIIIIGSCMLFVAISMGFRKLQSHMPVAGSCSAMMAVAAHRPEKDVDAAVMPVKWGVVADSGDGHDIGHCSFTSEEVTELQEGRMYAGM